MIKVLQMMDDYGVASRFPVRKEWYDGYAFGSTKVYNPWSVINFMSDLCADADAFISSSRSTEVGKRLS